MGSKQDATTTTNQSSTTNPWTPATPLLQGLIDKFGGINTSVTPDQSNAAQSLISSANSIPNMGPQAAGAVSNMFNTSTTPQVGMMTNAYDTLNSNIGGIAGGQQLDPYSVPGFGDALKTSMSDITNAVKGVYAGSGRSPSGAGSFAQSLGRGLTQGVAPTIMNEANTLRGNQMNAASTLFNAGGTTATGTANLNQIPIQNSIAGLQGAGMLGNLFTQPAQTQLGAATTAYGLPAANLQSLLQAGMGLGGMGSSSTGTGTSTSTPANNPLMNIMGGILGGAGLIFSDRRMKENIEEVGELHDGQKVYRFNYKGRQTPTVGLMADEVEKREPAAVHDIGGRKAVDYGKATDRAAKMAGMLSFRKAA